MTERPLSFQNLILTLHAFWSKQGCVILQPYDVEMGAGTFHPATTLRALGPRAWAAAYVQPSRRPTDGRYGENPNRLQHYYQYQVIIKPSPADAQDLLLASYRRSVWIRCGTISASSRTTGRTPPSAPGVWAGRCGATAWRWASSPISSRSAAFAVALPSFEMTYGLERLAMYVQDMENVFDLDFNGRTGVKLWRRVPARRARVQRVQFRIRRHQHADPPFRRRRGGVRGVC